MRKLCIFTFILLYTVAGHAASKVSKQNGLVKPESVGFSSERIARIDTFLENIILKNYYPNVVACIYRHGKLVYKTALGFKDIENHEPVAYNSIFRNASQTKAITSTGLMMLYEKGLFLLDDPVSKYIPEFENPRVIVEINKLDSTCTSRPAKRNITIRDLLTHTSGIPYGNEIYAKAHIPEVNSRENITIGEIVKRLAKLPLVHDPGEEFTYGLNIDVIGYLIELISGQNLDDYLEKYIFEPLEMTDSYFYLPKEKESRLVTLYSNDSIGGAFFSAININNQTFPYSGAKTYFSGGAGVVGTIQDYANFLSMFLNGGSFKGNQLLGRKTIELMLTNQIGDKEVWDSHDKFGIGFALKSEKSVIIQPGSIGAFSWGGMYCTDYFADPKEDMIALIYTNAFPFFNPDINKRFRVLVYQALIKE